MRQAGNGDTVTVHYIGTLDNGRIFHGTEDDAPLVFTIGSNQVFPVLERAVIGMSVGAVKNVVLTPEEAYGQRLEDNLLRVGRNSFPPEREIRVGQKLRIEFKGGVERMMLVIAVDEERVTLDGNHPLAGMTLTFALRLDGIE